MIRNHVLDPESSPSKQAGWVPPSYPTPGSMNNINTNTNDEHDPWYSSSSNPSPTNKGNMGNSNNFNFPGSYNSHYNDNTNEPRLSQVMEDYDNEPPLLEELGIRFDHIWMKTQAVVNPTKSLSEHILDDADLAGPLFFCLLLGSCLLLSGKVHFGYIYGFSVFGCAGMYAVLNLMHSSGIGFSMTCSVLGYCLLPIIGLAAMNIIIRLNGIFGLILSLVFICWSTYAAARLLDAKLHLSDQYWLVVYPISLLYSCFVLITIF